jgi:hypothetical protein
MGRGCALLRGEIRFEVNSSMLSQLRRRFVDHRRLERQSQSGFHDGEAESRVCYPYETSTRRERSGATHHYWLLSARQDVFFFQWPALFKMSCPCTIWQTVLVVEQVAVFGNMRSLSALLDMQLENGWSGLESHVYLEGVCLKRVIAGVFRVSRRF